MRHPKPEKTELELVRDEIRDLQNRIRIITSDLNYSEPIRREQEYHRLRDPLVTTLGRLQHKRTHGESLIAVYVARIDSLSREYAALNGGRERMARMLKLYRDINAVQGNKNVENPTQFGSIIDSIAASRERLVEIRGLLHAYRIEMIEVRRAMSGGFEQEEARLQASIDRLDTGFVEYLDNMRRGDEKIIEHRVKLAELRVRETDLARGGRVHELLSTMTEFMKLASELSPQQREYALQD